jgi:hypothetical protein
VGSGGVTLPAGASLRSIPKFQPGAGVDIAFTIDKPVLTGAGWVLGGFQRTNDWWDAEPWLIWISREAGAIHPEANIDPLVNTGGNDKPSDLGKRHVYTVERFASKTVYRYDLATPAHFAAAWGSAYNNDLQIRFTALDGAQATFRYARIRDVIDPAPTVTLGAKETHP